MASSAPLLPDRLSTGAPILARCLIALLAPLSITAASYLHRPLPVPPLVEAARPATLEDGPHYLSIGTEASLPVASGGPNSWAAPCLRGLPSSADHAAAASSYSPASGHALSATTHSVAAWEDCSLPSSVCLSASVAAPGRTPAVPNHSGPCAVADPPWAPSVAGGVTTYVVLPSASGSAALPAVVNLSLRGGGDHPSISGAVMLPTAATPSAPLLSQRSTGPHLRLLSPCPWTLQWPPLSL